MAEGLAMSRRLRAVSYGEGVQSTALLVLAATGRIDEAIRKHFDRDVADVFDREDFDEVAHVIQNMHAPESGRDVSDVIETIARNVPGNELDDLADGKVYSPAEWLRRQIN